MFFERALPNEYLVQIGKKDAKPLLGGSKFKLFRKFLRIPASVQKLQFKTDNANIHYQGIGIEGYANWRINPENPKTAIETLDFFGDANPMAKTSEALITICIEAVRHVIANMTIEDAMKKKDEIAANLKTQLNEIEKKWGIVIDQVGIEKVTVMSSKLFADLQSEFRSKLRLEAAKYQLSTDTQIASQENQNREKTTMEQLATNQKLEIAKLQNSTTIKNREIEEKQLILEKERQFKEKDFHKELEFNTVKEEKNAEFKTLESKLQLQLKDIEKQIIGADLVLQDLKDELSKKQIEIEKLSRANMQTYTSEELQAMMIQQLPEIFKNINFDNYSVFSGDEKGITPLAKIITEIVHVLKSNDNRLQNQ